MRTSPIPDEIKEAVKLANRHYGYFSPNGEQWLIEMALADWNGCQSSYQLRRLEPQMSEANIADTNSPPRMTWAFYNALSAKGRQCTMARLDELFGTMHSLWYFHRRQMQVLEMINSGARERSFPTTLLSSFGCCEAAMMRHKAEMPLVDYLDFPLPDCTNVVCCCQIRLYPLRDHAKGRRNL